MPADNDIRGLKMIPPDAGHIDKCNGCSLCLLSCPVWHNTRDPMLTFYGRSYFLKSGADPENIRAGAEACILCGSCEPVCPYDISTVDTTIALKTMFVRLPGTYVRPKQEERELARGGVLLASSLLLGNEDMLERTVDALGEGWGVFSDNGEDISKAFEEGVRVDPSRITEFVSSLSTAGKIVTTDGLIYRLLRKHLGWEKVSGLGEAMMNKPGIVSAISREDLYVVDPRTYHSDFNRLSKMYCELRRITGCMMNLDLHRVATPTGTTLTDRKTLDIPGQVEWILEGRNARRIIVEKIEDIVPFSTGSAKVLFIAELAGDGYL